LQTIQQGKKGRVQLRQDLCESLGHVIKVPEGILDHLLVAALSGGHALIEGIPGIGKTLLARSLAQALGGTCKRIQFTNDLLPTDILGTSVWRQDRGKFVFFPGPLFANIVLADEINRTSPRTLSSLLEAMEEGTVSLDGRTLELPKPFLVLATLNPMEFHGTFEMPEAAIDRFLLRLKLDYPSSENELALYLGNGGNLDSIPSLIRCEDWKEMQGQVPQVRILESVALYAHRVVMATRNHPAIRLGASPRAGMSWIHASKARALLMGRDFVLPDDLKNLAVPCIAHRLHSRDGGEATPFLEEILGEIPIEA
jgi:MoxR-like ATPase